MHDKTASFGPANVFVPQANHPYAITASHPHGHHPGPPPGGPPHALTSRTDPLTSSPHEASPPSGATAPVGMLPPGAPLAGLTAANLSLLQQSIPAAAKANPFSHPPAIRSKLSVEQGLQDALDSLIISGRPLMGRYTLDASAVREITATSVVQFASEVRPPAPPHVLHLRAMRTSRSGADQCSPPAA